MSLTANFLLISSPIFSLHWRSLHFCSIYAHFRSHFFMWTVAIPEKMKWKSFWENWPSSNRNKKKIEIDFRLIFRFVFIIAGITMTRTSWQKCMANVMRTNLISKDLLRPHNRQPVIRHTSIRAICSWHHTIMDPSCRHLWIRITVLLLHHVSK